MVGFSIYGLKYTNIYSFYPVSLTQFRAGPHATQKIEMHTSLQISNVPNPELTEPSSIQ